jgi:hypothetical protein
MHFSPHIDGDLYNGLKGYFKDIYSTRMMNEDDIKIRIFIKTYDPNIDVVIRVTQKDSYLIYTKNNSKTLSYRRFRNRNKAIKYLKEFLVGLNLTMETQSV